MSAPHLDLLLGLTQLSSLEAWIKSTICRHVAAILIFQHYRCLSISTVDTYLLLTMQRFLWWIWQFGLLLCVTDTSWLSEVFTKCQKCKKLWSSSTGCVTRRPEIGTQTGCHLPAESPKELHEKYWHGKGGWTSLQTKICLQVLKIYYCIWKKNVLSLINRLWWCHLSESCLELKTASLK